MKELVLGPRAREATPPQTDRIHLESTESTHIELRNLEPCGVLETRQSEVGRERSRLDVETERLESSVEVTGQSREESRRSPDEVRGLLSAYHRGVQRGRSAGSAEAEAAEAAGGSSKENEQ